MTSYASIEVDQLTLHGSTFTENHAVPKYYVDNAVQGAASRIDAMLEGSAPAFDTLIEIKNSMDSGASDLGTALTARVGELSGAIQAEVDAARAYEGDLRGEIQSEAGTRSDQYGELKSAADQEMLDREADVQGVRDALSFESSRAEDRETDLQNQHDNTVQENTVRFGGIDTAVLNVGTSITSLHDLVQEGLGTKLDKSLGYSKRDDGALLIENDHYLYLGTNWRLRASQGGKRQRLEFEYSGDSATWDLAIPFIRGA